MEFYTSSDYEHLSDADKELLDTLALSRVEGFNADMDCLTDHVTSVVRRRAAGGESLQIDAIIDEVSAFVMMKFDTTARADLLREISKLV